MGGLFGGALAEAGYDTVLVDVSAPAVAAINLHGPRIEERDGIGKPISQQVRHRSRMARLGSRGKRSTRATGRCSQLHRECGSGVFRLLHAQIARAQPGTSSA